MPYKLSGGQSFFGRNEIKDIMGYLRLFVNPPTTRRFCASSIPRAREIGQSTIEKLSEYSIMRGVSMPSAVDEMGLEQQITPKSLDRLRRFKHWLDGITRQAYGEPRAALKEMITDIDYEGWLAQNPGSPHQAEHYEERLVLDRLHQQDDHQGRRTGR